MGVFGLDQNDGLPLTRMTQVVCFSEGRFCSNTLAPDTLAPDRHIGTCGAHQLGVFGLDQNDGLPLTRMMSLRPGDMVRTICGQLVTSCLHLWVFATSLHTSPPHPPLPLLPSPCNTGVKLMHTFKKIV